MSPLWAVVALAVPPFAALGAWILLRPRGVRPLPGVALNALVPGAGLAAAGRPVLEVAAGVLLTQVVLIVIGGPADLWMYLPVMAFGGAWAAWYGPLNPLEHLSRALPDLTPGAAAPSGNTPADEPTPDPAGEDGYPVAVRCTECGAEVEFPVLHRMARCSFCGSEHLVVGHDELLHLAVPERIPDQPALIEALLDHYRHLRYLELYGRAVAPLERRVDGGGEDGGGYSPELAAAAAAAEAAVTRQADAYRRDLASRLELLGAWRFHSPYFHAMGTLYQAAFGREPPGEEKVLRFAADSREAAVRASDALDLPGMARLSWLKALRPAAALPAEVRCLLPDRPLHTVEAALGDPNRTHLARDLRTIRVAGRLRPDVRAVVWRPWWVCEVRRGRSHERLLVDSGSGSVVGPAPEIDDVTLAPLPRPEGSTGASLRFLPMECPTCGYEFRFEPDAVLHFCSNCHRVFGVEGDDKREVEYAHDPAGLADNLDLVPFWAFRLELRGSDGVLVTDLLELKDGIDGVLDQLGEEHRSARHSILVPAIRCGYARLTGRALESLFAHGLRRPPSPVRERFPLDSAPQPWPIGIDREEARELAPLLLATVFSRRDLARASVSQVATRLLDATLEGAARLVFAGVPKALGEPYRPYVGTPAAAALARARGT